MRTHRGESTTELPEGRWGGVGGANMVENLCVFFCLVFFTGRATFSSQFPNVNLFSCSVFRGQVNQLLQ